jgi:hypothetical protein
MSDLEKKTRKTKKPKAYVFSDGKVANTVLE